mgnify:FL=1
MKRHSKLGKIALNNALGGCDLVSHPSFYYSTFYKVITVISSIFEMNVSINYSQTKENVLVEVYMSKSKKQEENLNIKRMRNIVQNTEENLQEAEISAEFGDPIQQIKLNQENNRRKQSIKSLNEEIQEEVSNHKKD